MQSVARTRSWRSGGGSVLSHTTVTSAGPDDCGAVRYTVQREPQSPLGPAGVWASVLAKRSKRDGSSRSHGSNASRSPTASPACSVTECMAMLFRECAFPHTHHSIAE